MLGNRIQAVCLLIVLPFVSLSSIAAFACCSLHPAQFTNTISFVSELERDGKRIHLLGYENTARSGATGGNAMFLPIPAVPGTMSEKNIVDTSNIANFMDEMQTTVTKPLIDPLTALCVLAAICIGLCLRFRTTIMRALKRLISSWYSGIAIMTLLVLIGIAIALLWKWLDPTMQGVNTAGTVRGNNLANLEAAEYCRQHSRGRRLNRRSCDHCDWLRQEEFQSSAYCNWRSAHYYGTSISRNRELALCLWPRCQPD